MMKTIKLKKDKSNFKFTKTTSTLEIFDALSPLNESVLLISEFTGECHEFKFCSLSSECVTFTNAMANNPVKTLVYNLNAVDVETLKTQLLHKYDELFEYSDDRNYIKEQRHIKNCLQNLGVLK